MIRVNVVKYEEGTIYFDVCRDVRLCFTSIIYPHKNDMVKIRSWAYFEEMTAAEMRDLWRIKNDYDQKYHTFGPRRLC